MPLNPFLIGDQREGRDRVSYALACTLEAGGSGTLHAWLRSLGVEISPPPAGVPVVADVYSRDLEIRPSARLAIPGRVVALVAAATEPGALRRELVEGHLDQFEEARAGVTRALIAVGPDSTPPPWWGTLGMDHPEVVLAYASWIDVASWARAASQEAGPARAALLRALNGVLERAGLAKRLAREFDLDRVARIEEGADRWMEDLRHQHAAQEALLAAVRDQFFARVSSRVDVDALSVELRSRGPASWTPVSTYLELWWRQPDLSGWDHQPLVAEVFLRRWEHPQQLRMRTGVWMKTRSRVQRWFGPTQAAAEQVFGERYYTYVRRSAYAEVWADRAFEPTAGDSMREGIVEDLLAWIDAVLPGLQG